MTDFELVTAADVELMQALAQRVTATRPDMISAGASYGELAWVWGKGHASDGATWPRRLWFSGDKLWRGAAPSENSHLTRDAAAQAGQAQ